MNNDQKTKEFIIKCVEKFGDQFDLSHVTYINSKTKIDIICPKHGLFETTPALFLKSMKGCQKCWWISTKEDFVDRSREKYGSTPADAGPSGITKDCGPGREGNKLFAGLWRCRRPAEARAADRKLLSSDSSPP